MYFEALNTSSDSPYSWSCGAYITDIFYFPYPLHLERKVMKHVLGTPESIYKISVTSLYVFIDFTSIK